MADPARARKLAVRIRQIVSATIEMQIKDPRLGMVTITDARVTSDLREATVFYTVYGDATQVEDSARALASATGVLRSTVGKQTGIKFVPSLTFVADVVPDTARELEEALERVRHADAELARAREGAQYAGDADPYRKPAVAADDDEDDLDGEDDDAVGDPDAGRTDDFSDGRPSAAQRSAS
jgi:ribosome-binding factor A